MERQQQITPGVAAIILRDRLLLSVGASQAWGERIASLSAQPVPGVLGSERYFVGEVREAADLLADHLVSGQRPGRGDLLACLRAVRRPWATSHRQAWEDRAREKMRPSCITYSEWKARALAEGRQADTRRQQSDQF